MMGKGMAQRLQRYAAEIVGPRNEGSDRDGLKTITEDKLREMMDHLEDGTVLSIRFVKGDEDGERRR